MTKRGLGCSCCGAKVTEGVPCRDCTCDLCALVETPDDCCISWLNEGLERAAVIAETTCACVEMHEPNCRGGCFQAAKKIRALKKDTSA